MRLFVALTLPDAVAASLAALQSGVPGARWQAREQLHLTLRFIGDADGRDAAAIDDALSGFSESRFELRLKGVGEFGGNSPRALWAGVEASAPLLHLARKIEIALQRVGLEPEQRRFTPHVTLARLRGAPRGRVMDFLVDHALYASAPFEVGGFVLFSSRLASGGSIYVPERTYPLA
ncbi:MAG TPA: RNA 2',3'-cyclic phosphodiesterase [Rhizomicrobium sp.]|jgi:2'-5' RNA ligase|nr:RNA 2',3'-cyclic phosphodiesterase [Rhizomicrobium sp.]